MVQEDLPPRDLPLSVDPPETVLPSAQEEEVLVLAPTLKEQEVGAGKQLVSVAFDLDVRDQVAGTRPRGLGVGQAGIQASDPLLQHGPIVIEVRERDGFLVQGRLGTPPRAAWMSNRRGGLFAVGATHASLAQLGPRERKGGGHARLISSDQYW